LASLQLVVVVAAVVMVLRGVPVVLAAVQEPQKLLTLAVLVPEDRVATVVITSILAITATAVAVELLLRVVMQLRRFLEVVVQAPPVASAVLL
jgi:class 3 adenylate cyclase